VSKYHKNGKLKDEISGWGEAVKAAVVLMPNKTSTEEEIIGFCKQHQASYKAPKTVYSLTERPKTGSGKISKRP
jgi:acyl-CoA synthetase (AMP-forming)/AMP-acid ligase II